MIKINIEITGNASSGKSTIANALKNYFERTIFKGSVIIVEEQRPELNPDLAIINEHDVIIRVRQT